MNIAATDLKYYVGAIAGGAVIVFGIVRSDPQFIALGAGLIGAPALIPDKPAATTGEADAIETQGSADGEPETPDVAVSQTQAVADTASDEAVDEDEFF